MWRWWTASAGGGIVAFTFIQIFQDLFHPSQSGALSDYVGRTVFRIFHRRPSVLPLAGPLSLVIVILIWALLQALGFALIYWIGYPNSFALSQPERTGIGHVFCTMLYFSLEVMTTLGLGDLKPKPEWLRFLVTFQALTGFALVTASLSWLVMLYPALARLRTLARRTWILAQAEKKTGIDVISGDVESLLGDLAQDVVRTHVDFIHFPLIYYFTTTHPESSLANVLPQLADFAESGAKSKAERVRLASATLEVALEGLAQVLADKFVKADPDDTAAVFRAYADDQMIRYSNH